MENQVSTLLGMATPFHEFGNTEAEIREELLDYASLGTKWLRLDFYWGASQWQEGDDYNWSKLDMIIDITAELDIDIIGLLHGYRSDIDRGYTTDADRAAFAEFCAAAAKHFDGRVGTWEILNEQNVNGVSPEVYADLLKKSYEAIKAVDANSMVLFGGMAAVPETTEELWGAVEYLTTVYELGGKDYFDAFTFHPYTYPLMPETSESWNGWQIMEDGLRSTMVAYGDADKQIWITEMGAPTAGGDAAISEAELMTTMRQAVEMALSYDWAGPIIWYSYQDRGYDVDDTESWFGLVAPDGTPKDAYYLYRELAELALEIDETGENPFLSQILFEGTDDNNGLVGNDLDNTLIGNGGNDKLEGGNGDDILIGGTGQDTLIGGEGEDTFAKVDLWSYDIIEDFEKGDKIALFSIDADQTVEGHQSFNFVESNWLKNPGDLAFYINTGSNLTHVMAQVDQSGSYMHFVMKGVHTLTADDFILTAPPVVEDPVAEDPDPEVADVADETSEAMTYSLTANQSIFIDTFKMGDIISLAELDGDSSVAGQQGFEFIGSAWLTGAAQVGVYHNYGNDRTYVQASFSDSVSIDAEIVLDGIFDLTASNFILERVVEDLKITGTLNGDELTGEDGDDILDALGGDDLLVGGDGDDALYGGAGADQLFGGNGADVLVGGAGDDTLSGGSNSDIFVFQAASGRDLIVDFDEADYLDLSQIDANLNENGEQSFTFIGSAWLTGAGQVGAYIDYANEKTYVQARVSADKANDIKFVLDGVHELAVEDFIL